MDNLTLSECTSKNINSSVEEEVVLALNSLLEQFKDRKKGLRILAQKMGIHEKTLVRLSNLENKPSYQTVFKIFRVYLNEYNDAKLLELVPECIKEFLLKSNPQEVRQENIFTSDADLELQKNPIIAEIYVLAGTGALNINEIEYRFGKYGVEMLGRMVDKKLLTEAHRGVYIVGNNRPQFTADTIVAVGKTLIESHAKPVNGEELDQHFISFFAEGLSEDAYKEWLAIDQEAFRKKFELSNNPKNLGAVRAFTFMISEKMIIEDLQ